jgi:diguanylate cyclase (GGDEF)-like protein
MRVSVRDSDIIGRFGGEEFVVLMPETQLPEAEKAAKRLCDAIDTLVIDTEKGNVRVTISVGVSAWSEKMLTAENFIDAADKAMYAAKSTGNNRVGVAQSVYQVE